VTTLEEVEDAVLKLGPEEQQELRDWLENLLEDRLEMTEAFKEDIAAGKADLAAGRSRIRQP
jgi:hypothetical protein